MYFFSPQLRYLKSLTNFIHTIITDKIINLKIHYLMSKNFNI